MATLAAAAVAVRIAPVLLRRRGLQGLQRALLRRTRPSPRPTDEAAQVSAVAGLVGVASAFGPARPNCLARSVVLWWFLARRGIPAEIRIGVRRNSDGQGMEFHAWVEHRGKVLNDAADLRQQFATFDRAIVPAGAQFD